MNALALVEDRAVREQYIDRVDVLDKVKALSLLPDDTHATTEQVSEYYKVPQETIRSVVHDHYDEIESDGMRVLTGVELSSFKKLCGIQSRARSLSIYPRRAILRIGMLLRDSEVAKRVRDYLLNVEEVSTPEQRHISVESIGLDKHPSELTKLDLITMAQNFLNMAKESEEERLRLESELRQAQPKVDAYEQFLGADGKHTMDVVAKSIGWGRNKLFKFLRMNKVLKANNLPYQQYIDAGYFNVRMVTRNGKTFAQTIVTPQGHDYIFRLVRERNVMMLSLDV